jgi:ABC-type multidrug transport system ATPase subunit
MNEMVLQTRNITKKYSGKVVVDDVSMAIQKGDNLEDYFISLIGGK